MKPANLGRDGSVGVERIVRAETVYVVWYPRRERNPEREVLRVAAGLGARMGERWAEAIACAARTASVIPERPEMLLAEVPAHGIVGSIGGRIYALGIASFLQQWGGIVPSKEVRRVATAEAQRGGELLFLATMQPPAIVAILSLHAAGFTDRERPDRRSWL